MQISKEQQRTSIKSFWILASLVIPKNMLSTTSKLFLEMFNSLRLVHAVFKRSTVVSRNSTDGSSRLFPKFNRRTSVDFEIVSTGSSSFYRLIKAMPVVVFLMVSFQEMNLHWTCHSGLMDLL